MVGGHDALASISGNPGAGDVDRHGAGGYAGRQDAGRFPEIVAWFVVMRAVDVSRGSSPPMEAARTTRG
jgi:hypothetical protein